MLSTSILLLLILTLSSTTTAVTIEPNEAAVKGDISPATSTNPWTRLAHLFQDVQRLNGHERESGQGRSSSSSSLYPFAVEVFSHLAERNFILRKLTQSFVSWVSRNWGWTTLLYLEFTHLVETEHGQAGQMNDKASHAVSEVITVMGHSGFSLLLWALSGFVDRHGSHVEGVDEFYQDNTVESAGVFLFWSTMAVFYIINGSLGG